jgi:hypothetical protein
MNWKIGSKGIPLNISHDMNVISDLAFAEF